MGEWWLFVAERLPELIDRIGEHILLTGFSTVMAMLIGIPLGTLVFWYPKLRTPIMGLVGIIQTIPSIALLVLLLALFQQIGVMPALIALTLYALLPIVRNTLTGLQLVPKETMEAARGIGMTGWQQLTMVRLPLAFPVIVSGLRTAANIGVGIATIAAFIGAGGLGQFINRGLFLNNTDLILLGAIPAALLALLIDFSIAFLEWSLKQQPKAEIRKIQRRLKPLAVSLPVMLLFTGFVLVYGKDIFSDNEPAIHIGGKSFTEQLIIGEVLAQLIEHETDLKVERHFALGGTMVVHNALLAGEIDLAVEYTGTALISVLGLPVMTDPENVLNTVKKAYQKQFGLVWLQPFGFNNTYVLAVDEAQAKREGWKRISDLIDDAPEMTAGFDFEFAEREDGYLGLKRKYGLEFGEIYDLDPNMMHDIIHSGEVDVISGYATDGRLISYNLRVLEDDRQVLPPYHAVPVIREEVLKNYPQVKTAIEPLFGRISDADMRELNRRVDEEKQSPAEVARAFLRSEGLLD